MCMKCLEVAKKHFPGHTDAEYGELLMSATAFPFAPVEYIEKQLIEAATLFGNDMGKAISYAATQMEFNFHGFDLEMKVDGQNANPEANTPAQEKLHQLPDGSDRPQGA